MTAGDDVGQVAVPRQDTGTGGLVELAQVRPAPAPRPELVVRGVEPPRPRRARRPSDEDPVPAAATDLDAWLVARLSGLRPWETAAELARAEALACGRFPPVTVVAAIRRVLASGRLDG